MKKIPIPVLAGLLALLVLGTTAQAKTARPGASDRWRVRDWCLRQAWHPSLHREGGPESSPCCSG